MTRVLLSALMPLLLAGAALAQSDFGTGTKKHRPTFDEVVTDSEATVRAETVRRG